MVKIPNPKRNSYRLLALDKNDIFEIFDIFKTTSILDFCISMEITVIDGKHKIIPLLGVDYLYLENELKKILSSPDEIITGFCIKGSQDGIGVERKIIILLSLNNSTANLFVTEPKGISKEDARAIKGLKADLQDFFIKHERKLEIAFAEELGIAAVFVLLLIPYYLLYLLKIDLLSLTTALFLIMIPTVYIWGKWRDKIIKSKRVIFVESSKQFNLKLKVFEILKRNKERIEGGIIVLIFAVITRLLGV